jgi:hypothetical protein
MSSEDVKKLRLIVEDDAKDLATGKPSHYAVSGLPLHLQATITGGQTGYQYHLRRTGDPTKYDQNQSSSAEDAFTALKRLLAWDPL